MQLVTWICGLIFCGFNLLSADCTTIYFVRHGQTDWNLNSRMQSVEDNPLNETGRNQAQQLSATFKDIPFKAVFTSGLKRANETASILIAGKPLEIKTDKRFVERNYGSWEGKLKADFHLAKAQDKLDVETDEAVLKRTMEALTEIAKSYPDSNVLVVAHGAVLRNTITSLLNVPPSSVKPENTGYVVLDYCDGKWTIKDMKKITQRAPREEN